MTVCGTTSSSNLIDCSMNQSPNDNPPVPFPLRVTSRFMNYFDRHAKKHDLAEFPVRLILDARQGLDIETPAELDPASDFLLSGQRVRIFINRQQAFRLSGWSLETVSTIDVPDSPRLTAPADLSSASSPGRLKLDRQLVSLVQPELNGWSGWLWRMRDQITGAERYEGSFAWLGEHINKGDSRGALVLQVVPHLLVAAYSDEFDCVVGLRFPARIARFHKLQPGDRLVTCNQYASGDEPVYQDLVVGPHALMNQKFFNFRAVIANFVSSDSARLKSLESRISSTEWTRLNAASQNWLDRCRAGTVRPRIGAPLWAHAGPEDPPLIDVPIWERAAAATVDLVLVTLLVATVWWFYLGFDDVFQQYLANPRQPAVRASFKTASNQIRMMSSVVFLIYCTIMLPSPLQATFGKLLFRMQVIRRQTGGRISLLGSIHRTSMLLLGVFPALWSLIHSTEREPLHDESAKTRVVRIVGG